LFAVNREGEWGLDWGLGFPVARDTSERDTCLLNKLDVFSKIVLHETDVVIRFQRQF